MTEFKDGQLVLYKGINGYEIGKIKRIRNDKKRLFGITAEILPH